ncbi:MAG: sigma factor-like helix-turn-helix DNA-binding protein, partial [Actinomycetota bacterium]
VGDLPVDIATGDDTARLAEASFVADVLRRLSPEHQEVVVRAVLNGESTREIAMGIGVPAGTVKSRLHYGLRALRALLEAEGILR